MKQSRMVRRVAALLGPAFVAAVAYVDPGNFAANFSAGANHGYLLLWVLVLSNIMAAVVQYWSAKVGVVSGESLPELVAHRLPRAPRLMYWAQAELVAIACDVAEVVGGALALKILFGVPLPLGGIVVGLVSLMLLGLYNRREQHIFERIIIGLLLIIPIGFVMGLVEHPPHLEGMIGGLVPRFDGEGSVMLASAMLGATIMPHVIYLHSALARDKHGKVRTHEVLTYLRATKIDVALAMVVAGTVNIAMLVLAAAVLRGGGPVETFEEIHAQLGATLGPLVAWLFALGLLVSGLASTSVGGQAGSVIMDGLLNVRLATVWRRVITIAPAIALLIIGFDPTHLLIISQVALSFGIPFALIPLYLAARNRRVMGRFVASRRDGAVIGIITLLVVALNIALIWQTFAH